MARPHMSASACPCTARCIALQVALLAPSGTPRRLKNGCVEYIDSETGQRTRVAGDRCIALLSSLDALIDPTLTDDEPVDNEAALRALLDELDPKRESRHVPEDGALRTSTVLNRTRLATPPTTQQLDEKMVEKMSTDPQTPHKRTRMGENVRPRAAAPKTQSEELFMRHYQNFCVLDDVLHRTSGQRGFSGHGEKVRVEMKSLEDGYKYVGSVLAFLSSECRLWMIDGVNTAEKKSRATCIPETTSNARFQTACAESASSGILRILEC